MRIRKPAEKKKENDNWGEIIETDGKGGKKKVPDDLPWGVGLSLFRMRDKPARERGGIPT